MGLDLVEFVMDLEETFCLDIPDSEAEKISTPRGVIDFITHHLRHREPDRCATQVAFNRLRRAAVSSTGVRRWQLRPATPWPAVLPRVRARWVWSKIRARSQLDLPFPSKAQTVGEAARAAVARFPERFSVPEGGWTRDKVALVVNRLIVDKLGVKRFTEDSNFITDMGLD